jgi:hypothetical protein
MYYYGYVTVKTITVNELPKARRKRISPIKKTRDWEDAIDRITSGDFEALEIDFSPETLKLGSSVPERFKRMLADEITRLGLASALRLTFRGLTTREPVLYVVRRDKQRNLFSSTAALAEEKTRRSAVKHESRTRQQTK